MRKFQSLLLKLSVTCVVLWLVLREVELDRLVASLRSMDPSYLPWLMLLTVSARAIMAAKWNMFLRLGGVCVGLPRLFRIVLLSDFYMLLFPTALTAEAIRLLLLKLQGYSLTMSASATLADRLLDTYVPNVEHNHSNKFYFMYQFNKLPAPPYSLPLAGGGREPAPAKAGGGVERRYSSERLNPHPILPPSRGKGSKRAYNFKYLWLALGRPHRPRAAPGGYGCPPV
jgi:hypothetical protein